jgi:hypothetical protein
MKAHSDIRGNRAEYQVCESSHDSLQFRERAFIKLKLTTVRAAVQLKRKSMPSWKISLE